MTAASPPVAVAMAVYNDARYLALTLEALALQTFRAFTLTLYDDGSTDGSAEVAERCAQRLPLQLIRGAHVGRHRAKQESWQRSPPAPYLLVLDSDLVLPADALERMVREMETDPSIGAVSARYRAAAGRPFGAGQAFMDDVFFDANFTPSGDFRWIVGGCVLLRRSALEGVELRADLGEDHALSQLLRGRFRLVLVDGVVAIHHGVPVTLLGMLRRFDREAVRVRALLRAYPEAWQWGSLVRLVPLPLCLAAALGAVLRSRPTVLGAAALLAGYLLAFLLASRRTRGGLLARLEGAFVFTFGNLGFGLGFLRESLRGSAPVMREPERPA